MIHASLQCKRKPVCAHRLLIRRSTARVSIRLCPLNSSKWLPIPRREGTHQLKFRRHNHFIRRVRIAACASHYCIRLDSGNQRRHYALDIFRCAVCVDAPQVPEKSLRLDAIHRPRRCARPRHEKGAMVSSMAILAMITKRRFSTTASTPKMGTEPRQRRAFHRGRASTTHRSCLRRGRTLSTSEVPN
jgi:hypothetical protein